jgi:aspartate aminotransferase
MQKSDLVGKLKPSPTLALNQKAKALQAAGKSVINLTAGEPDFPTPDRICKAAIEAISRRETRYTATSGIVELKDAILKTIEKKYGRKYGRQSVIVANGAKQALANLCLALLNPGDEAIIIAPYWVSYVDMVVAAGANPVVVKTSEEREFSPTADQIASAITKRTKLVFLNSPSNPTGGVYSEKLLRDLASIVKRHPDLVVVTDDIYDSFVFDGHPFFSIAHTDLPENQLVVINGVSKTYAMTGWRIGYAIAPADLIGNMDMIQSNSTSNASSISQWAAVEALNGDQSDVFEMRKVFEQRRNEALVLLQKIDGLTCFKPKGAFYFFPNLNAFIGKKSPSGKEIQNDLDLGAYLLEECGVATVPGSGFGAEGFTRLSFAASLRDLENGIERMKLGLSHLKH